ncbi:MAG: 6-carboxytetrahydropterin synthase [bacterium]
MKKITLLTKRFYFNGAHKMSNDTFSGPENEKAFGLCQNIHGHNYSLDVSVGGEMDQKTQCIVDLEVMKNIVKKNVILVLDHHYINDVLAKLANLKGLPISLENLGSWIWDVLDREFKKNNIILEKIFLAESETTSVTISRK